MIGNNPNVKRSIFLGAGFTVNWGGPTARQLSHALTMSPQLRAFPEVRRKLFESMDYEGVLHELSADPRLAMQHDALVNAIVEAFRRVDGVIRQTLMRGKQDQPVHLFNLNYAFTQFLRPDDSHIFTVNQDILLERMLKIYREKDGSNPQSAGMPGIRDTHGLLLGNPDLHRLPLDHLTLSPFQKTADYDFVNDREARVIKLHGSSNWRDQDKTVLISGREKEGSIEKFQLLSFYFRLFKRWMLDPRKAKTVLFIGYSFGDPHINNVLMDAIKLGNTRFVIWDLDPNRALGNLVQHLTEPEVNRVYEAFLGPISETLATVFPPNQDQHIQGMWERAARFFDLIADWETGYE